MQFRYHPIVENLKVNEDGSEILKNGEALKINVNTAKQRLPIKTVSINRRKITTTRLVCEAWIGIAPTGEHAARRIDEAKGDHYSNLYWGKRGMTESAVKGAKRDKKITESMFVEINERLKKETFKDVLKAFQISKMCFYRYQKQHVEKNK